MSNLVPKRIVNKNNVTTTVHVKADAAGTTSGRGIPAPMLMNVAAKSTASAPASERKMNLLDRLMKPWTDRKEAQEAAIRRQQQEEQLSADISTYLPSGMNLSPKAKENLNAGIAKLNSDIMTAVQKHLKRRNGTVLSIMDVLEMSKDPNGELRRITDHFDYAYRRLGWHYPASACEFIVESLPDEGMTKEQERAILKMQDRAYTKHMTPHGGSSSRNGQEFNAAARRCAAERPEDIDRIIVLAQERNLLNVADYHALLDAEVDGVLAEGNL